MITFSKLEKKGHLGNQLFQIASTIGIAVKSNQDFSFPKWSYSQYFEKQLPLSSNTVCTPFKEKQFHFEDVELESRDYDLEGWFQSENYFDVKLTKDYLTFKSDFLKDIKNRYEKAFAKSTILISIRRGDFVDHPDYFQLPITYYLQALISNFPDWNDRNLILLSDDIPYCKFHFSFLENVFFADGLSAIQQLGLASLCDDFIISNSTFSWWCAWLGEKKNSKVIRPLHYFSQSKKEKDNDKDYFPERWINFNHLKEKIKLENTHIVTIKENEILEKYLKHNFNFENENQKIELDTDLTLNYKNGKNLFIINDCILPPFLIYFATQNQENSIGYLKGIYLNISEYWDKKSFEKQFDFGFFSRILKTKNILRDKNKLIFVSLFMTEKNQNVLNHKKTNQSKDFPPVNCKVFYSFAGKIKRLFECKYYWTVQKRRFIITIKTRIKKAISPKKIIRNACKFCNLSFSLL